MEKTKRQQSIDRYHKRKGLKRKWIGDDLITILESGMYGDNAIESSTTIAELLKNMSPE